MSVYSGLMELIFIPQIGYTHINKRYLGERTCEFVWLIQCCWLWKSSSNKSAFSERERERGMATIII